MREFTHILALQQNQPMGKPFTAGQRAKAWAVHFFTASGILTVFMALLAGTRQDYAAAMWWLLAAQLIDGVDGTLARYFRVTDVLPEMSGKRIDFVIDFAAYAIIPAFLIHQAGIIEAPYSLGATFLILITSAIYYGKSGMISDDHYFIGFPVMWNMLAFYLLFIFDWGSWGNLLLILFLAVLQFLPVKFPYPSRTKRWMGLNIAATVIFVICFVGTLAYYPRELGLFYWGSIGTLLYFALFSVLATFYFKE